MTMEYYEFQAMGSDILLAAEGESQHVSSGFEQARGFIEASERRLSRFQEDSELSRLNRSSGNWFQASQDLFDLVQSARFFYHQTGGLFNPAVLNALKQAGYDRSIELLRPQDASVPVTNQALAVPDFDQLSLDADHLAIYLPPGMGIDLGGIAKGWIAGRAAHILKEYAHACTVSAGGDMVMLGVPSSSEFWQVSLEDPRDFDRTLAILNLGPGAVATSSVTRRRWRQGDRFQHHLIDPRTGEPVESPWLSVTVVASRAVTAEVYAKTLLISGRADWDEQLPSTVVIAIGVDREGHLWGSSRSWEVLNGSRQFAVV